jgi:hypothetical protein
MNTYSRDEFWVVDDVVSALISVVEPKGIGDRDKAASFWDIRLLKPRNLLGATNDRIRAVASSSDFPPSTSGLGRLVDLRGRDGECDLPAWASLALSWAL